MEKELIRIGNNNSPVLVSNNIKKDFKRWWQLSIGTHKETPIIIIADEVLYDYHNETLESLFSEIPVQIIELRKIKSSEQIKSPQIALEILEDWSSKNVTRDTVVICIGGGTITDLGGFLSSIFKRGLRCVFIPTTLLAMTDASLGGKNAINLNYSKNQIGTFYLPKFTMISLEFLNSLSKDNLSSGYAEMMKHAILQNKSFTNKMLNINDLSVKPSTNLLVESIRFKLKIVNKDPKEKKERIFLNLGHTFGHAYESYYSYINQSISHGNAVAKGLAEALFFSFKLKGFNEKTMYDIVAWIKKHYSLDELPNYEQISNFIKKDKKHINSGLKLVLLKSIGSPETLVIEEKLCKEIHTEFWEFIANI